MTTETLTLSAFLEARIAEDEAASSAASVGDWQAISWAPKRDGFCVEVGMWAVADSALEADATHIARHDPVRVLAECKAKRAIMESVALWKHEVVEDCWYTCPAATEEVDGGETCNDAVRGTGCDCGRDYKAGMILRALASVYSDHPDYDDRWAL